MAEIKTERLDGYRRLIDIARDLASTLDLDILLFGQRLIDEPRLQVPHYHLHARAFVLYPLAELAPQLSLADGRQLSALLAACPFTGLQRLTPHDTNNPLA